MQQQTQTLEELFASLETLPSAPEASLPSASSFVADGRISDPAQALRFIMAGNATVTLVSKKTESRFTYRIRASEDGNCHFVALLNGSDNESSYAYFGYVRRGVFFYGGQKAKVTEDRPSVRGFKWAFEQFSRGIMPDSLEVWHEGRCGRCARKLTVPSSIASGFGPECEGRMM
ncbi:MAG TPA: DUF6011 domain-containing protein [Gemmatimonadaceae bacterium]|jgi:hypothetical protein|nr:DUF6011 domain-containing protein [Gemmatimonadaceae bacterium]